MKALERKVTFKRRPEGGEEVNNAGGWEKKSLGRKNRECEHLAMTVCGGWCRDSKETSRLKPTER